MPDPREMAEETPARLAAIGSESSAALFRAYGLEVSVPGPEADAAELLKRLAAAGAAVVFVPEELAAELKPALEALESESFPCVIPVPGAAPGGETGRKLMRDIVRQALGVDVYSERIAGDA